MSKNKSIHFSWELEGSEGCAICPFERNGSCTHNAIPSMKVDLAERIPYECPLRKGATLIYLDGSEDEELEDD